MWAVRNETKFPTGTLTLGGKPPIRFALDNNLLSYDVRVYIHLNPQKFNDEDRKKIMTFSKNDPSGLYFLSTLIKGGKKVNGIDALEYAADNDLVTEFIVLNCIKQKRVIKGQHPILYACEKSILISGLHPMVYGIRANIRIGSLYVVTYCHPDKIPFPYSPAILLELLSSTLLCGVPRRLHQEMCKFALLSNFNIGNQPPMKFCNMYNITFDEKLAKIWLREELLKRKQNGFLQRAVEPLATSEASSSSAAEQQLSV
jgi:hypothetical protein